MFTYHFLLLGKAIGNNLSTALSGLKELKKPGLLCFFRSAFKQALV